MSSSNKHTEDLGLDTKSSSKEYRSLNKDGTFNIKKTNLPFMARLNFFHSLVSMHWLKFLGVILLSYFTINIVFATLYLLVGIEHLTAFTPESPFRQFMKAFFFSAQTITTLGYGRVAPLGLVANTIAAVESMLGLLLFALGTGLLYGRFSKPSTKIIYSRNAIIAPYRGVSGLMFRMVNARNNQLLEVEVTVNLSLQKPDADRREFHQLALERNKVVFFPSLWTIVHPIEESSPIHGMGLAQLYENDVEIIISLRAFDESFSQTVYSRCSYKASEFKWGEKFVYINQINDGTIQIDVARLNETEKAEISL
ncbi:MAG: ion channel [Flavobacteriales bacterium]